MMIHINIFSILNCVVKVLEQNYKFKNNYDYPRSTLDNNYA